MSTMQMDELIGNLQTYELKKIDKVAEEPKNEGYMGLKTDQHDSESDDEEMIMFIQRCGKKDMVVFIGKIALHKSEDEHESDLNQHSKVISTTQTEGTIKETYFVNVPSGFGHELKNSGEQTLKQ
ncbi:hypothetical protein HAX54_022704 [Datura stramonium]|uniref:Uncharacterized protein n=1 Tax=Datura stramonium TaxID=4076 RepID=A0ABS8UX73_DATST|nr:hypothetical protein [Datura stramonium]